MIYSLGLADGYGFRLEDSRYRSWLYLSEELVECFDGEEIEQVLDRHRISELLRKNSPCTLHVGVSGVDRLDPSPA